VVLQRRRALRRDVLAYQVRRQNLKKGGQSFLGIQFF
jgi:hypothetical protein